jgi:hypothetical protein
MNQLTGIYLQMYQAWNKPIVLRNDQELSGFSFGLIKSRAYMSNLDSRGEGPKSKQNAGSQVYYDAADLAQWLESRYSVSGTEGQVIASNGREVKYFDKLEDVDFNEFSFVVDHEGNILSPQR